MDRYYIWLIMLFRTADPLIHKVLEHYGSAENAYREMSGGDLRFLDEAQKKSFSGITLKKADEIAAFCEKSGVSIVTIESEDYPVLLREIHNPPVLLFYRGSLECMRDKLCITAVGAREIKPYIGKLCGRVCSDLAERGVVIVSGMARGVDSVAHNACVQRGKPTVGVLACGINYDYPKGSGELRERIVMNGGAYLTELLPGTSPSPEYFRARNRILAGLSKGTAVFQAGLESGSLITASYAADEGRDVFCVPPPDIFDQSYAGVIRFLRDGAVPLFNHDDIITEYPYYFTEERGKTNEAY